jgi:hypothetical protein
MRARTSAGEGGYIVVEEVVSGGNASKLATALKPGDRIKAVTARNLVRPIATRYSCAAAACTLVASSAEEATQIGQGCIVVVLCTQSLSTPGEPSHGRLSAATAVTSSTKLSGGCTMAVHGNLADVVLRCWCCATNKWTHATGMHVALLQRL